MKHQRTSETGSVIVTILALLLFLSTMIFSLVLLAQSNLVRARARIISLQAQYAAESGADSSIARLNAGTLNYSATDVQLLDSTQYRATYTVSTTAGVDDKEKIITATGKVYSPAGSTTPKYTRTIRVVAQRTASSTSSAVLSRNILDVASGVKDIRAKDIYINSYIRLHKNTTNLIAENITVAGKYTDAANCSIGGTGNLIKPTTFANPGQTKTNITTSYNNCISPPGNTSNADFNVATNQSVVAQLSSTYLPWNEKMDGTYQNSANNCNDWTTGSSPRDIPSTGNTKKTHYPDSNSNISTSCGGGTIDLGTNQYNIHDHVHLRANMCSGGGCAPIFNNPTSDLKFIFVEGTARFKALRTATGSGPIALVSYGADITSGSCPFGSSIYLGKDNIETNAPDMYLLSTGGICLDDTKFGANPALGGVGGKNVYIATNSGTPFDLGLDTSFPSEQIPLDLVWRAVRYQKQ